MTHTPGPWTATEQFDEWNESLGILIESPAGDVTRIFDTSEEGYANARLIAAAPDLLAALEDALSYIEDVLADPAQLAAFKPGIVRAHAKAARAAIARATGA